MSVRCMSTDAQCCQYLSVRRENNRWQSVCDRTAGVTDMPGIERLADTPRTCDEPRHQLVCLWRSAGCRSALPDRTRSSSRSGLHKMTSASSVKKNSVLTRFAAANLINCWRYHPPHLGKSRRAGSRSSSFITVSGKEFHVRQNLATYGNSRGGATTKMVSKRSVAANLDNDVSRIWHRPKLSA